MTFALPYAFSLSSYAVRYVMKRKLKHWLSTIAPISTKEAITSHLKSLNIKKTPHHNNVWNPGPDSGQAQKCGCIKPFNDITTLPVLITRSPTVIQMYKQTIKRPVFSFQDRMAG